MKGGIACFVAAALDYLKANGGLQRGSLSFLITGDEEGVAINGTAKVLDWLKARGETLDACVVGEPASAEAVGDEIKIGRRGYVNAELVVHGKQGHSAYAAARREPDPEAGAHHRPRCRRRRSMRARRTSSRPACRRPSSRCRTPRPTSSRRGARQLQHPLQRPAHARRASRPGCASTASTRPREVGAQLLAELLRHGRRVPHQARAAGRHHARRGAGGDRAHAGADHQRRHLGCALHHRTSAR